MYYNLLYNNSAKINTILDLHHEIYTLLDISHTFHYVASTFEMPEVIAHLQSVSFTIAYNVKIFIQLAV